VAGHWRLRTLKSNDHRLGLLLSVSVYIMYCKLVINSRILEDLVRFNRILVRFSGMSEVLVGFSGMSEVLVGFSGMVVY
jgi:hypothetical protein